MKVYVESNFVLELTLSQEQHHSCEAILNLCEKGVHALALPSFSVPEPFGALVAKAKNRSKLISDFQAERGQLSRSALYDDYTSTLLEVESFLSTTIDSEATRFHSQVDRLLSVATSLALDREVFTTADQLRREGMITPYFDSIVLASVLVDLRASRRVPSCFLNRNSRDFDEPQIVSRLAELGCSIRFNFDDGLAYLVSQTS